MNIGCSPAYVFAHFGEEATYDDVIWSIKQIAKLGFKGLELETYNKVQMEIFTDERIKNITGLYRSLGLRSPEVIAHSLKDELVSMNRGRRENVIKEFAMIVEICGKLEIISVINIPSAIPAEMVSEYMRTYPGAPPKKLAVPASETWDDIWRVYVETISQCLKIAEDAGMAIAIEACPYTIISSSDSFLRLTDEIGSKNLGLNLDTAHLFVQKEYLPVTVEKLGDRLFNTHICDNDGNIDNHWLPGKGEIDWEGFIGSLRKIEYKGFLNIEVNVIKNPDKGYLEGKKYLEEILARIQD